MPSSQGTGRREGAAGAGHRENIYVIRSSGTGWGLLSHTRIHRLSREHFVSWPMAQRFASGIRPRLVNEFTPATVRLLELWSRASSGGPLFHDTALRTTPAAHSPLNPDAVRLPGLSVAQGIVLASVIQDNAVLSRSHPTAPDYEADYRRLVPHPPPLHRHRVLTYVLAHLQRTPSRTRPSIPT